MEYADYILGSIVIISIGIHLFVKQIKVNLYFQFVFYLLAVFLMIFNMLLNRSAVEEILSLGHGNPYAILEANSFMIRINIIFIVYNLIYIIFISRLALKARI